MELEDELREDVLNAIKEEETPKKEIEDKMWEYVQVYRKNKEVSKERMEVYANVVDLYLKYIHRRN